MVLSKKMSGNVMLAGLFAAAALGVSASAWANTTVSWNLCNQGQQGGNNQNSGNNNEHGNTGQYNNLGASYCFTGSDSQTDLTAYCYNQSGNYDLHNSNNGLHDYGNSGNNGSQGNQGNSNDGYVQFDCSNLIADCGSAINDCTVTITCSFTDNNNWNHGNNNNNNDNQITICDSNQQGQSNRGDNCGNINLSSTNPTCTINGGDLSHCQYLTLSCNDWNHCYISSISCNNPGTPTSAAPTATPIPATASLTLAGFMGMGLMLLARRRRMA